MPGAEDVAAMSTPVAGVVVRPQLFQRDHLLQSTSRATHRSGVSLAQRRDLFPPFNSVHQHRPRIRDLWPEGALDAENVLFVASVYVSAAPRTGFEKYQFIITDKQDAERYYTAIRTFVSMQI